MWNFTRYTLIALYISAGLGCGALGGDPTSDALPTAGVTGWRKLPQKPGTSIREPFVLCASSNYRAPSVVRADGGYRLWYTTTAGSIGLATAGDGIYDWSDEGPIDLPDAGPWGEAGVALHDGNYLLAAAAADRSRIALFDSTDGETWTTLSEVVPDAVWEGGGVGGPEPFRDPVRDLWILYYDAGVAPDAIAKAESDDGGATWSKGAGPLFTAADVRGRGWSAFEVGQPAAGIDTTRPGPPVYKIWFTGRQLFGTFPPGEDSSIGYAGSFDGELWTLYDENPVLAQKSIEVPGQPAVRTDERGPSVLSYGNDYRMYFEQPFTSALDDITRPCVALALAP